VLHVPDTADRYYVLQFVDAWTNNFAYIGRRATGTGEARYLLAGPGYQGSTLEGMQLVSAPTGVAMIVGRVQVDGASDVPAARALQDQFTLTPLSVQQGGAPPGAPAGIPAGDPQVSEELQWWESFRVQLAAFPPPRPTRRCWRSAGLKARRSWIRRPGRVRPGRRPRPGPGSHQQREA
jgi:hypothetical protein